MNIGRKLPDEISSLHACQVGEKLTLDGQFTRHVNVFRLRTLVGSLVYMFVFVCWHPQVFVHQQGGVCKEGKPVGIHDRH